MVVFLANRTNLQSKRLHDRIRTRLSDEFDTVQRRRAEPREAGQYRVVGEVNPRRYLDDAEYPATTARVEVGFQLQPNDSYEYYWFNWIEPDRSTLVGWHQDDTHADLGPVHRQVNDGSEAIDQQRARFIDSHPLDVVERRLGALPAVLSAVEWDGERPVGFDPTVAAVE
ncbi:hypothetical protein [Natrinema salifodinae]|uniref:Uncharacterized protein n=1 Tax=Natrinema salifodinae TaxID=1202768 RepID=A0A1I0QSG7_9EURY|nr:hypothetical protein [Natrinema salifodinae]SEW30171.1 hypothetical protein SAMN05216285_3815 [Natrinema salifodinae]